MKKITVSELLKYDEQYDKGFRDGITQFAKRLIAISHPYADTQIVFEIQIKNLLKEMESENSQ